PWPSVEVSARDARRPHAHRCFTCCAVYACPGPAETGLCAPVCPPCYWVELGVQERFYEAMVAAFIRKRAKLERRVGARACRNAQRERRALLRRADLVAGLGGVAMRTDDRAMRNGIETTNGAYDAHPAG
ncbi:MAG: hypothetical protein ACREQF_07575, partial [Candidatus Binataceae bacterium]